MRTNAFLFVLLALAAVVSCQNQTHCVWRGVCQKEELRIYNCPYDGPGEPVNDGAAEEILFRRCPHLYKDSETDLNGLIKN